MPKVPTRYSEAITEISKPKDNRKSLSTKPKHLRYDKFAKETKDSIFVTAVEITSGNNVIFKVKSSRNGKLYNPIEENNTYGLDKLQRDSKDLMFKLVEVNEKCFKNYLQFLKTRNNSYLTIAEREK